MSGILQQTGRVLKGVRWYFTNLMGDQAYAGYVSHQQATHPEEPPMTNREFWADRYKEQERNPSSRCC